MKNKNEKKDTYSKREIEYNAYNNSKCPDDYKERMIITAIRINNEMVSNNLKQQELAKKIDISSGSMSNYKRGITKTPNNVIKKLAEVFGCSEDYLSGKSNVRTKNTNIKQICDYMNLSEESVKYILTEKQIANLLKYENIRKILNAICIYIQSSFILDKEKSYTNEFSKAANLASQSIVIIPYYMDKLLEEINNDEDDFYSNF